MTESFAQLFEQSLANQRIRPGMILTGLVVGVTDDVVIVNVGLQTEAGIGILAGVPVISSTTLSQITFTFGLAISLSCRMRSDRNESRRWTTVTVVAILARYSASSTAELPPPITATSLPR